MATQYEEPKLTKNENDVLAETTETHPAYAQISASRVSGRIYLYGSDFDHQHYVTIRIKSSQLNRNLSRDWVYARQEYIEVALSEAQWATFVSAMNQGYGVQCTLQSVKGQSVPQIPAPKDRHDEIKSEAAKTCQKAIDRLKTCRASIEGCKLSAKQKGELTQHIDFAVRDLTESLQFVADSFGEHIEKVTEHAKIEVNAYIQNAISRAGLTALQAQSPIALPESTPRD